MKGVYIVKQYDTNDNLFGEPVGVFLSQDKAYKRASELNKKYGFGAVLDENGEVIEVEDDCYAYYTVSFMIIEG